MPAVTCAFFDDDQDAFNNDAALGDKSGIRGGKTMTKLQFHIMQGHIGHHPDCWIHLAAVGVAMLKKSPGHFQLKYHYQRECVEAGHVIFIQV